MPSWPAAQHDDLAAHHYNLSTGLPLAAPNPATSSNTLNLPQRKQIIGFAKFRTREEALSARDVLQGRRVDIEKGAVLKAEMAKKNLHTKRGVGPVPGSMPPPAGGPSNPAMQIQQQQQQHDTTLFGPTSDFAPSSLPSSSQQNSIPALSRLGWRDSSSVPLSVGAAPFTQQQIAEPSASNSILNGLSAAASTTTSAVEDDRKRDSTSTSLLTLGGLTLAPTASSSTPTIGNNAHQLHMPLLSARGARERVAADDDEQQWRRREENLRDMKDMKLRAMDTVAYDAFHRVSPAASNLSSSAPSAGVIGSASGISRQSSSSTSLSLSTSNAPWTPNSVPTTAPSGDSENGRKLDDGGIDEENIELESTAEVNRRREEDGDYETLERRDFQDEQEQSEHEHGTEVHLSNNTNLTNTTTTNEIVGPWDRINAAGSYAAVARSNIPAAAAARTRTGSERSTSPPPPSQPSSSFSMGPNLGMNEASSSHQHLGHHQQQYSNQYGYHQNLQPSSQVQNQNYQNQYQHLHMHQQQMLQQQQQQREREAFMHQYQQQQQQQQYRSSQSESGESTGDPTSSTNPAGYVGAGAMRLGMLNTNTNGASPNPNGNGNSIPPASASSTSSSSSMTLSRQQPSFPGDGIGIVGGPSGVASVPSSGSTSSSSNNGGNASPQLPSPTSGASSGGSSSTTSLTSAISVGGGGSGSLRGTVDQNPPVSVLFSFR